MKLKPAKQALADAIHQNGGWADGEFSAQNVSGDVRGFDCKPKWIQVLGLWQCDSEHYQWFWLDENIPNYHQCILSRDEYFTAYPKQVKVEANNETEHKVEEEMKSESEMTIKASDWHKKGEFPPAGDVCEVEYNTTPSVWESVRVVGFDDGECVFRWISGGNAGLIGAYSHPKDFRPLRTERDMAIDEMVGEFIDHYGDPKGGERYLGIAAKLYDAGYRKEVK